MYLYLCVCVWQKSETRCRVIVGWGLTRPCRVEIHRLGDWSLHQQPWSTTCHLSNHHSPHPPHRLRPGMSFFFFRFLCVGPPLIISGFVKRTCSQDGERVRLWKLGKDLWQEQRQNRRFILKPRFENEIAPTKELMALTSWFIKREPETFYSKSLKKDGQFAGKKNTLGFVEWRRNKRKVRIVAQFQPFRQVWWWWWRWETSEGCPKVKECGIISEKVDCGRRQQFRHPPHQRSLSAPHPPLKSSRDCLWMENDTYMTKRFHTSTTNCEIATTPPWKKWNNLVKYEKVDVDHPRPP